jgi:type IV secretion system protein VirB1
MDLAAIVQQCTPPNVSPQTMHAIMRVESAHTPTAIGYKIIRKDGTVYTLQKQPSTREQAITWAKWFEQNGYAFDAGISQVNSKNFKKYGLTIETVFDPCKNINAGARILTECYARALPRYSNNEQLALRAAMSCYQSGNFSTGFSTGYVGKVVKVALGG